MLSGRPDGFGPAMAGIDIALWDLMGKVCGQPVATLLGGYSDRASVYGSGGMYGPSITPETLGAEMAAAVARGVGGIKIKGGGTSAGRGCRPRAALCAKRSAPMRD